MIMAMKTMLIILSSWTIFRNKNRTLKYLVLNIYYIRYSIKWVVFHLSGRSGDSSLSNLETNSASLTY